jgi:hypothetical protein
MEKFIINQTHYADNKDQLAERLQAFQDLSDNLEHEDLITSVEVLKEHPEIVDFIKDVAPKEGEELSMTDYLKIATKAFRKFA